jgi:pyruvate formate lyase activating enzyme
MSLTGILEAGNRHDLRCGLSPDAPDESELNSSSEGAGAFGYVHSYESASRYDGPGLRVVLFVSGCLLRCVYCHNPDTWHLKDGTRISLQQVIDRLGDFASALRALGGGLTISGGEPMVQLEFTRRIFQAAKGMGLHTAIETSGFLGERADKAYLSAIDLVLLDIKSGNPETYKAVTGRDLQPTLRFAERLAAIGKPAWVRFTLVPGVTDDPENVERIAKFVAPMKNVEWVEIQPFHQLGAFKWKALGLDYPMANGTAPSPVLVERVRDQFRSAGCRVR